MRCDKGKAKRNFVALLEFLTGFCKYATKEVHIQTLASREKNFWKWLRQSPRWLVITFCIFVILPMVFGYILLYQIAVWFYNHAHQPAYPSLESVAYVKIPESLQPETRVQLDAQMHKIRDSLAMEMPYSVNTPLPPFELRMQEIFDTRETAFLYHCRMWCNCREDLPDGSFELIIFELSPTAYTHKLVADTVMRWEDYVQPFNLQPTEKEVNE